MKKVFKWFDKNLFNHVGRTIQNYAIISVIIDIIAVVLLCILTLGDAPFIALIVLACGLGYALIFAFPIYAFGQLVEDIHKTQENTSGKETDIDELPEL